MIRWLRHVPVAGILLCLAPVLPAVHAAEAPVDERPHLRLSFSPLEIATVPSEFQYLAFSIPRLLREGVGNIPDRTQDPDEIRAYAEDLIARAVTDREAAIRSRVTTRDNLLFDRSARADGRRQELNREIADLHAERLFLLSLSPADLQVQETLPLSRADAPAGVQGFPVEDVEADVDLIVSGILDFEDGYVVLRLGLYRSVTDDAIMLPAILVRPEDVNNEVPALADRVARLVLGRESASLTVDPERSDAAVFVNGELRGFGRVVLPYVRPGQYSVRVTAPGTREFRTSISLEPRAAQELRPHLLSVERPPVEIRTEPPGADVFVGARFVGQTPITLERPVGPRTAELRQEGFRTRRFVLDTGGESELLFRLQTDDRDPRDVLVERREGFYTALGWFAVSVPVPLMLGGIFQSEVSYIVGNASIPQEDRVQRGEFLRTVQTAQAIGVAVSGGLLVNSIVQLARYIQAGRYYHSD